MKPNTATFLMSFVLAIMSAGLAYQTAMVFVHGGGNIPNAFGFIISAWTFGYSVLGMPRLSMLRS